MNRDHLSIPLAAKPTLLKQINYARLLDLLRCRAPITRAELARCTGLTRSTVTVITAELIAEGLVRESQEITSPGSGRPGVGLVLDPDGAFFIGAAIEFDYLTVVEMNLLAQITQRLQEPSGPDKSPEALLQRSVQLIERVRSNARYPQRLRGIGLAVQGTLSLDSVVIHSPSLGWNQVNLRQHLQPQIDLPLFVDNDANAAALAEVYLGHANKVGNANVDSTNESESLLFLLINNGIGSGIVTHNQVWRGSRGTAGEVGAMLLQPSSFQKPDSQHPNDQPTKLNQWIGKRSLLKRYVERGGTALDLNTLMNDFTQGRELAVDLVQEWGNVLSWVLVAMANVLNPERIVIGGTLAPLIPHIKHQLEQSLHESVPGNGPDGFFSDPNAQLDVSTFGEDAAAVGGAVLVYQSLFRVPDLVLLQGRSRQELT